MKNFIYQSQWGWLSSGVSLGIVFLLTVALVKPIGVSTQFVILDGIVWNFFSDQIVADDKNAKSGYSSPNAYLNKSGGKYAKNVANPLNYSFIFVLAMIAGGFIARRLQSGNESKDKSIVPKIWGDRYGHSPSKRYLATFVGGFLALFGARLAGGCTSGHMMSGMMQTSLSGYLFALGTFAVAVPVAILMYKGEK
ncbi:YeeE/YedE thiosulfate transporter family protein [Desulfobacula sp.]|uniref:YeeE/YedE thiosulfate transporter family protein n=1 Tax=Desulfobacula sp. TaxID=2593537 RepID=UPI002626CA60|nr:YeeE/YedE thiosulfate transporter family protein [Desulfobacula sp.]